MRGDCGMRNNYTHVYTKEPSALKMSGFEESDLLLPDVFSDEKKCIAKTSSRCDNKTYSDRYNDASASLVILCALLIFMMRAGFLYVEMAFSMPQKRRKVLLMKYCDFFAGTLGFWLFGYAISGNTDAVALGAEQDFLFWFIRLLYATNAATLIGGTLVGQGVGMRTAATCLYSFAMTAFIHPGLAHLFWSTRQISGISAIFSPFQTCNGTLTASLNHEMTYQDHGMHLYFYDIAGCGLVHMCGGTAAFVLSVFHKLETSKKTKRLQNLPLLGRKDNIRKLQKDNDPNKGQMSASQWEQKRGFIHWMYYSEQGMIESATLGVFILWTSWFCYAIGATEAIGGKMSHARVGRICTNLCLAAASGGVTQASISGLVQMRYRHTHYNTNELANAVLASLVAVTGCCAFIEPPWAILIGCELVIVTLAYLYYPYAVSAVGFYHIGCFIEYILGLHDGARVFPVHAVCGFWGVLCVGLFSRFCFIQELYDNLCYCHTSHPPQSVGDRGLRMLIQSIGGVFIFFWSLTLVTVLFSLLWYFPVKVALNCLPTLLHGNDVRRGRLYFEGNMLFTHGGEIESPECATTDKDQ